jgi:hypothetical protein
VTIGSFAANLDAELDHLQDRLFSRRYRPFPLTPASDLGISMRSSLVRYADDFLVLCKTPGEAAEALEITDYLVGQLELTLNREKTRTTSSEQGFKFLGAIFLKDAIYLPFDRPRPERIPPSLPPPLDLLAYEGGAG